MVITGNGLYLFICFSVTLVTPFIYISVLQKHGTSDSIVSFFVCFPVQVLLILADSYYLRHISFFFLSSLKCQSVQPPCSIGQVFLHMLHIFVFILLLLSVTFTIFTLATFNPWSNRSVIRGWFVFPIIYIFLNITITSIIIECYVTHLPWICFNAGFIKHTYHFLVEFIFQSLSLSKRYRNFVPLPPSVITWLIWIVFLVINDFLLVTFLFKAM